MMSVQIAKSFMEKWEAFPPSNIPGLREMFLHRITYILQKGES